MPGRYPKGGDRVSCISEGYKCAGAGYRYATVRASGWPWVRYGGAQASYSSFGPHNCTLYAAFRLERNGLKFPGWYDNAGSWYRHVSRRRVNHRPAVGAIAEWSTHVAYVEAVGVSGITISDDRLGKRSLADSLHPPRRQGTAVAARLQERHLLVEGLGRIGCALADGLGREAAFDPQSIDLPLPEEARGEGLRAPARPDSESAAPAREPPGLVPLAAPGAINAAEATRWRPRTHARFAEDFAFRLSPEDWEALRCQTGISSRERGAA